MEKQRDVQGAEENKPEIFGRAESPVPVFAQSNFFDEGLLGKERSELAEHLKLVTRDVEQRFIGSSKDIARWRELNSKLIHSFDHSKAVDDKWDDLQVTPENYTYGTLLTLTGLGLGIGLLRQTTLKNLISISRKYSFEDEYVPLAKAIGFSTAPELSICIGSVTLQDFMSVSKKTANPIPYYRYLAEINSDTEEERQRIFEQNQDYPKNLYPNITKSAIVKIQNHLGAVLAGLSFEGTPSPIFRESTKLLARVTEGVEIIREKIYQSVFDPRSEGFSDLSKLVQKYLEAQDKRARISNLYLMGLDTKGRVIEAYRKSRKYVAEYDNEQFYNVLGDLIFEYAEEASPFLDILTKENIPEILDTDDLESGTEEAEPSFEQLGKVVSEIFSKTSKQMYAVDPDTVDWKNLSTPQQVQVHFDNRPKKFSVTLTFDNELGEAMSMAYTIDSYKNLKDWNFVEDPMLPENSEIIALKGNLLFATQGILGDVSRQAQEEYQRRRTSKAVPDSTGVTAQPKRERFEDPIYKLRKDVKTQQGEERANLSSLFEALSSKEEIKNRVILPSDEEFEDMVRYLSHVDREIVRKSIEEYNEKGTGAKFARKRKIGTEGEVVYGLSIGCSVPKGARVLLREVESVNDGTRNFEVIDIRYRKDIYPKNKL